MKKDEFSVIRQELNLSQKELANFLLVSIRAIQSYEQGWRAIPPDIERNLLLLLMHHRHGIKKPRLVHCHTIKNCSEEQKKHCTAYREFAHNLCWYLSGMNFQGKNTITWAEKIEKCRECEVFLYLFKKQH
ncbi:MAG: helix-turn-helix domain-containing protein [Candidatus Brocadiae bacterium]|nr:helix-turn-helix domain-containing protein [Candidatus Brocadiia bacterium]